MIPKISSVRYIFKKFQNLTRTTSAVTRKTYYCDQPMGIRQNAWTPTQRRGPIAAEAASPGPAVVSLPSLIGKTRLCLDGLSEIPKGILTFFGV